MMTDLEQFRKPFALALRLLLGRWNLWLAGEPVRALDIAFDCFNTEICVSLLTTREPAIELSGENPLKEPWPVGSWRLTGINKTARHCFPDVADLVKWMSDRARGPEAAEDIAFVNEQLKGFLFEIVTSDMIQSELQQFKGIVRPFPIRVHWFFEQEPPLYFELA